MAKGVVSICVGDRPYRQNTTVHPTRGLSSKFVRFDVDEGDAREVCDDHCARVWGGSLSESDLIGDLMSTKKSALSSACVGGVHATVYSISCCPLATSNFDAFCA